MFKNEFEKCDPSQSRRLVGSSDSFLLRRMPSSVQETPFSAMLRALKAAVFEIASQTSDLRSLGSLGDEIHILEKGLGRRGLDLNRLDSRDGLRRLGVGR